MVPKRISFISILLLLTANIVCNAQLFNVQKDNIDVLKYQFHIQISDATNTIVAKANEAIFLKKRVDSIFLQLKTLKNDGKGMQVFSVKNQFEKDLAFKHTDDQLIIYNPGNWIPNDVLKLEIQYAGIPEDGLYISNNMHNRKTFFGDNWPNRAHNWLPVIDHPSDKALVEFFITAPNHYEIIASGGLVSKKAIQNDQNYYHFKTKQTLPTKIMVIGVADFKIKELDTIGGIPVSSWIYKETTDKAFDDYKPAVAVLKFYNSLLGAFSYEKLANVQSKTRFGGMENAGNIFYSEESANGKNKVEALVAHEVAHQWFGDAVTEKEWRDIWLSEGFATYLTDVYLEHTYGKEKLKERMKMERDKVIKYAAYSKIKPIVYDEDENLFKLLNRNSYEKGAWVLHMLRNRIGDEAFFKTLKQFYNKFKNKNADTADFIALASSISEMDLDSFFDQWLYRATIPNLKLDWKISANKLIIDVQQVNDVYQINLPVAVMYAENSQDFILNIYEEQHHFEFPVHIDTKKVSFIIDPEVVVLFKKQ